MFSLAHTLFFFFFLCNLGQWCSDSFMKAFSWHETMGSLLLKQTVYNCVKWQNKWSNQHHWSSVLSRAPTSVPLLSTFHRNKFKVSPQTGQSRLLRRSTAYWPDQVVQVCQGLNAPFQIPLPGPKCTSSSCILSQHICRLVHILHTGKWCLKNDMAIISFTVD